MTIRMIRTIIIGAVALSLSLVAIASPAGASTSHPKFVKAVHKMAPATKHVPNKVLVAFGEHVCYEINDYALSFTPSAQQVYIVADQMKAYDDSYGDPVAYKHLGMFLVDSVVYLHPSYDSILYDAVIQYSGYPLASIGIGTLVSPLVKPPPPPTTTTTLPSTDNSYTPAGWVGTWQDDQMWSQMGQFFPGDQVDPDSVYYITTNIDIAGVDLEKAMTPGQIQYLFQNSGIPPAVASGMIVEAAAWLCPNYNVEVDTWYNATSGEPPLNISGNTTIQGNSDPTITGPGGNSGNSGNTGSGAALPPPPPPSYTPTTVPGDTEVTCTYYVSSGGLAPSQPSTCPTVRGRLGGSGSTATCHWYGSPGNWSGPSSDPGACLGFPVDGGQ
jgi:hypothetical protein